MASFRASLLIIASMFLLAACARNPVVQLYEGNARADAQVTTLRVPSQLEIYTINGKEVTGANTFFNSGYKDLKLLPGRYEVIAYYKELWDLNADDHEVMKSDPAKFIVDGKAGGFYRLDYKRPENPDQAKALEANFSGWVENVSTGEKVPSQPSGLVLNRGILAPLTGSEVKAAGGDNVAPQNAIAPQGAPQPAPAKPAHAGTPAPAGNTVAPAASYLDTLKAQWNQATPEERREFLQWISK
ncbi:DUF2057 domain-containing protein [Alloalcanivorax mobilis]|uniref:DUF2057 domain-containing protein n=1 Tax=Alloalcanivorax mobilis TaxID=2019569 RepID=UPI000B5B0D66|nr:DUF2057 domain-containing protein [Alloalcanivorax mobilis]ASK35578.1 DUF2057 domain-containing protein [Alcanivorax sp. N3-2A]|tara:strand:+ start:5779 stop:6507 length:729 start_codon:yes stop_codon:yes gene_type:complete